MKVRWLVSTATVAVALALASSPIATAQTSQPLSKKEAKKILKQSEKSLDNARAANRRGDAAAAADYAARYTERMERLNRALANGTVDEGDALDVAARVDQATLKHVPVLEGVLERVLDQAKPAIERALQVSRRGHDTATEAILNRGRVSLSGGVLTDRAARAAMEKNEALLKHAQRARKRGDHATVRRSVEQYTANISSVGRAIEQGAVDESEAVSVLDRVSRNTRRHISVLEGLLGKVPEQARPAIDRALRVSQRGHQAATEALRRTPAAGVRTGRPGAAGSPTGVGGRPGGAGPASGKRGGRPGGKRGGPPR